MTSFLLWTAALMSPLLSALLQFLLGVLFAWLGGELFVRGMVRLGRWARLPGAVVGVTIAAFATSSPEIAIAVKCSLGGVSSISMGDVLGSNVANIALVLAVALLIAPLRVRLVDVRRDLACTAATPVIVGLLAMDGELSRLDGAILLGTFLIWVTVVVMEAASHRDDLHQVHPHRLWIMPVLSGCGLAFLIAAGHFIVTGAKGLALACGLSEFAVGATVVAVATSVPEMATTLIAKAKGHDDLGLGYTLWMVRQGGP